jgi:hypothetical protein
MSDLPITPEEEDAWREAAARKGDWRVEYGTKRWAYLTDEEIKEIIGPWGDTPIKGYTRQLFDRIEAKIREKNS